MCGGNYTAISGLITTPGYPSFYPRMSDCIYLISQPAAKYINLTIVNIDTDCDHAMGPDYIEIRDGLLENSPLMARFCGNGSNIPEVLQTTQNFLRIRWEIAFKY